MNQHTRSFEAVRRITLINDSTESSNFGSRLTWILGNSPSNSSRLGIDSIPATLTCFNLDHFGQLHDQESDHELWQELHQRLFANRFQHIQTRDATHPQKQPSYFLARFLDPLDGRQGCLMWSTRRLFNALCNNGSKVNLESIRPWPNNSQ